MHLMALADALQQASAYIQTATASREHKAGPLLHTSSKCHVLKPSRKDTMMTSLVEQE
jgi:hypothetical protein